MLIFFHSFPFMIVSIAQGAARILNVFWEAIPPAACRALVDRLVAVSHDARSPGVRAAVPEAVAFLLSQARPSTLPCP
jgi:hypothetical protein